MPCVMSTARRILATAVVLLSLAAAAGFAAGNGEKAATGDEAAAPLVASPGVLVAGVEAGSPAEKAGIVRGDIIVAAGGSAVNTPSELRAAIASKKPGDALSLSVRHGDVEKKVSATLAARSGAPWLGVVIEAAGRGDIDGMGPGMRGRGRGPGDGPVDGSGAFAAGAFVTGVVAGSPAEKAGLAEGDLILSLDGTAIDGDHALADLVGARKPGDEVTLSVQSGKKAARDVKITLGKNPDTNGAFLGVRYALPVTVGGRGLPMLRGQLGTLANGVLVAEVTRGSPAEKAGLAAGDLIMKFDGTGVTDPQQVVDAVGGRAPGDTVTITVTRGTDTKDLAVVLGAKAADAKKAWLGISMSALPTLRGGPGTMRQGPPRGTDGSSPAAPGGSGNEAGTPTL